MLLDAEACETREQEEISEITLNKKSQSENTVVHEETELHRALYWLYLFA